MPAAACWLLQRVVADDSFLQCGELPSDGDVIYYQVAHVHYRRANKKQDRGGQTTAFVFAIRSLDHHAPLPANLPCDVTV